MRQAADGRRQTADGRRQTADGRRQWFHFGNVPLRYSTLGAFPEGGLLFA
jgi:hypothetical protein